MIQEALELLAQQAVKASTPHVIEQTAESMVVVVNGKIETIDRHHKPRAHFISCLDDMITLANRFHEGAIAEDAPVVWYDENDVVLVIDDLDHRCHTARFTLKSSDIFTRILTLAKLGPQSQKQFVRLLRVELAGTLQPGILLNQVRKIKFDNGTVTSGHLARDRESLGREINSRVESDGEIPETVTLEVPVYKSLGERCTYSLACAVEVDPGNMTFQLIPLPDEIERVQQLAVESIGERLHAGLDKAVPAYYGRP